MQSHFFKNNNEKDNQYKQLSSGPESGEPGVKNNKQNEGKQSSAQPQRQTMGIANVDADPECCKACGECACACCDLTGQALTMCCPS
jgi:hypothetical protein